ncbi:hypothetical protein F5Y07DRAFT_276953 [Xylaria sp. FL0933]|nr:hypothetical protein F5Y07DRAFT_276953 [Xylaria sp. FL0933]
MGGASGPTPSAPSTFTVSCPFSACEKEFSSEDALREHTSSSHVGQHLVVSKYPFKCHCGQEYTKLSSLERHVRGSDKSLVAKHSCHECTAYQGKDGFRRKDHLVQHLRVFHKYDNDQLATLFRPRQGRMYNIPVCHFESCEYYRGPEFKGMGIGRQMNNRPFHRQSDYTMHMKREHDWSPYPCKVAGCNKLDGKGFFNITALEKHCKEKHPGCTISVQKPQNGVAKTVRCDYCHKDLQPGSLANHQWLSCEGEAPCPYCGETMKSLELSNHKERLCKAKVTCNYCSEVLEAREKQKHDDKFCTGEVQCFKCSQRGERRSMEESSRYWFQQHRFRCADCIALGVRF